MDLSFGGHSSTHYSACFLLLGRILILHVAHALPLLASHQSGLVPRVPSSSSSPSQRHPPHAALCSVRPQATSKSRLETSRNFAAQGWSPADTAPAQGAPLPLPRHGCSANCAAIPLMSDPQDSRRPGTLLCCSLLAAPGAQGPGVLCCLKMLLDAGERIR